MSIRRKATVAEVAAEVAALNPHLTVERLMADVEVDPADASRVVGDLEWDKKRITVLPDSIGSLTVGGKLCLHMNQLASLPEGFGSLTVGGDLSLEDNQLALLPEGFGSLTVGGDVYLHSNLIAAELHPDSFVGLALELEDDNY